MEGAGGVACNGDQGEQLGRPKQRPLTRVLVCPLKIIFVDVAEEGEDAVVEAEELVRERVGREERGEGGG